MPVAKTRKPLQVKGMIQEMIEKLVAEAQKEASHKVFALLQFV